MHAMTAVLLSSFLATTLNAQEHDHSMAIEGGGKFPPGWMVRTDENAPAATVKFEAMPPGWHVTTGSSTIIYRPIDQAKTQYSVRSQMHLFPSKGSHEEAFGLFIGGQNLDGAGERYTYFLIRGDGTFKVKRRNGAETSDLTKDWTPSPVVKMVSSDGSVANNLALQVVKGKVSFLVNGQVVYSVAADSVDTDGIVGLRMNHNLSVHVENLDIGRM